MSFEKWRAKQTCRERERDKDWLLVILMDDIEYITWGTLGAPWVAVERVGSPN